VPTPLASVVFWAAVLCCVVAEVAIVRSAALSRAGAGVDGPRLPSVRRGAEVMWAVLPALALAGVLVWTWREMRARGAPDRAIPVAAPDAGRPTGAVP
jgi:hypothetical protein